MKSQSDEFLIEACLGGDERAWATLVARYKNLVYSVPVRYRLSPEDAADVFQAVWLELFSELGKLRNAGAIRSWLLTVAAHKCYHLRKRQAARLESSEDSETLEGLTASAITPVWFAQLEREQVLREAIDRLPARCQEMIRMLFYSDPPLPYQEVAQRLGLAEGSIGFIRGRCLDKLRSLLKELGF